MKKMDVQIDFGITDRMHTLYKPYFEFPPKGINYKKSEFRVINGKRFEQIKSLYNIYKIWIKKLFPKIERKANNFLRKDQEFDLIHFANHIGITRISFVADYEHAYNFVDSNEPYNKRNKKTALKNLNQKSLRFLLPINKESLKSFKYFFGKELGWIKQEVIYPTLFIKNEFRKKIKKEKKILFIGSSNINTNEAFYIKGGYETLLAFDNLSKKYPKYKFIVISKIPEEIKFKPKRNFIIKDIIPQKELWEIMNESQIFVQPNYHTPAMAYLEAMFFKLPIITYDKWANKEYVDNKNGVVITPQLINNIDKNNVPRYSEKTFSQIKKNASENAKKIEKAVIRLIKNPALRKKMGENGFKRVTEGEFSVKKRNEKLLKIYKEALKHG